MIELDRDNLFDEVVKESGITELVYKYFVEEEREILQQRIEPMEVACLMAIIIGYQKGYMKI